ncbi:hypothetical protein R5R35_006689 [Gryllus longicercus]|uniref:Lipase domain-containing protein n=1 Tax=Gryllus longicercus TaxID=2509291 RepID=A0AAN9VY07_9ORTH
MRARPRRRPPPRAAAAPAASSAAAAAAAAAALLLLRAALICGAARGAGAWRWATPAQEAEDERRDAEILRAVVRSMDEWGRRAAARRAAAGATANATANATHAPLRRRERAAGVCYPEVGCFSDSGVFGYLDMLPSPPEEVGTRFQVFASGGGGGGGAGEGEGDGAGAGGGITAPLLDVAFANRSAVLALRGAFDPAKPTKVIVHGFGSSCAHVWVYEMRSALMAVEECNVICVDWEGGAAVPNYVRAAANTRLVGKQLALLLQALAARGLHPQRVHIIGFSLGAHVAGFAGAELRNLSRITGLDPAGPLFEGQDPRARLDESDADFVDVIHSNGENLILGGLGSWQPMGHVDFYPNGGRMQKGCSNLFVGAVSDILWSASDIEGRSLCNHRRAYKFFTDSVSPRCHFPAFPCASYEDFLAGTCFPCSGARRCGNMGYYADRSSGRGALFLVTRDEEPFCAHQYSVRLESAAGEAGAPSSYGSLHITLAGDAPGLNETFPLTQKEDEQLKPGQSLTRLLVPHPALAAPTTATLVYTAYAGWWSSGLPAWPVRKLAIVDSFGKSMSVCRRDLLLLQTGVPTTLQLFPGECHPPAAPASATNASSAPTSTTSTAAPPPQAAAEKGEEAEKGAGTGVGAGAEGDELTALLAGAAPLRPWPVPLLDGGDGGGNSLEDSRAFHSAPAALPAAPPAPSPTTTAAPAPVPSPTPAPAPASASSASSSPPPPPPPPEPLPDIKEPVLTPRTSPAPAPAAEEGDGADGGGRAARLAGRFSSEADTRLWIPAADLNPPPLSSPPAWRHWALARAPAPALAPTPTPAHADARAPRTLQFLPQRLVALLSQAERFARRALGGEVAEVEGDGKGKDKDGDDAAGPRRSKALATAAPPPLPPAVALDARGGGGGGGGGALVALAHGAAAARGSVNGGGGGGGGREADARRFIPLVFPEAGAEPRAPVTVTPEDIRSSFRSVKVQSAGAGAAAPAPLADDALRPVYKGRARRRRRRGLGCSSAMFAASALCQ